ncbi:MAG: hypothetical protein NTU73_06470, partial [Ignavibacteriae bacterium]|nr:hypothetical protein [Ignavibacteriota bacterium]
IISAFKMLLEKYDLSDELFDKFYEQLLEAKLKIIDGSEKGFMNEIQDYKDNGLVDFNKYTVDESSRMDDKVNELENKIRRLYEKKIPASFESSGIDSSRSDDLKNKLMDVEKQIKNIYLANKENQLKYENLKITGQPDNTDKYSQDTKDLLDRLISIDERIKHISSITSSLEDKKEIEETIKKTRQSEDLYKKLFDSFYNQTSKTSELKEEEGIERHMQKEEIIKDKLKTIDLKINEIKDSINTLYESKPELKQVSMSVDTINEEAKTTDAEVETDQKIDEIKLSEEDEKIKIEAKKITKHGVLVLTPKAKKEGIFNDANLTEDYELGYRFYELGFKTGFFNIKLDKNDDATRIATAEFFPNTFWTSVKQRSRWIAGICFQNWKSHKWKGNISTKYFLFRDRKSIFSFFGAFLSNIVILYFLYAILANLFHFKYAYSLVSHSSVLWYLMIANLIFMISRASHRFIFTYNWYGFKYAFFSFFRLVLDTFINFFAIMRSIDVFRKTKKKVVWDATSHY